MAKNKEFKEEEALEIQEVKEMTAQEARAYRTSLHKESLKSMTEQEKREAFRIYWAQEKTKYGKSKDLEEVLWLHLKSVKLDKPEEFETGIRHFGLIKIR